MHPNKLIPDWELPKSIGLVWPNKIPEGKEGRRYLVPFYTEFIELLQEYCSRISLNIIHRPGEKERLTKNFNKGEIETIEEKDVQDIWIRDFAPFWKRVGSDVVAVKAHYYPTYGGRIYLKYSKHDDDIGIKLGGDTIEHLKFDEKRIILDGGNLIHNGKGFGICTDRLIADNEHLFKEDVIDAIKNYLGLQTLLIIPPEHGDDTGHVDGLVRFINNETVLVSKYPYKWKKSKCFIPKDDYTLAINQLEELEKYFNNKGLKVYRIPNGIPYDSIFESAVGNYMNFFRVGDIIFIPQYGRREQDQNAVDALIEAGIKENNIVRVTGCTELAELGGVLNCITTHIYK